VPKLPNLPIFYAMQGQIVPVQVSFMNPNGQLADPDSVVLTITDPTGDATTYNYTAGGTDPDEIIKDSPGKYRFNFMVPDSAAPGLWNVMWVGAGSSIANGAQVTPSSFRLFGVDTAAGRDRTYVSIEELKSSINDNSTQTKDDYEMQRACITSTSLIHDLCGQHFFQIQEARTFSYDSITEMFIDAVVPGSITKFALDYDGDGVYEVEWTEGVNYQTSRCNERYNTRWLGEERPHDYVQVLMGNGGAIPTGGGLLPFVWAYTPSNRVQITATWGWQEVPWNIHHAALLLAVDLFKAKDAPWGVAGTSELGLVRVQANPQIMELLAKYREPRSLVGV
jgi:hypothetical protein